jgi:hypothetical protein
MAFRLGEYVAYGELRNLRNYKTFGFLVLRAKNEGDEVVIHLDLTGDCDPDLKGKCLRFRPRENDPLQEIFNPAKFAGFQHMQIGPTGTMTAKGWVKTFDCPIEEFLQRSNLGEPPPTTWRRRLYLEWYSQNGRVVVEMADPVIEECVRQPEGEDDEGDWALLPHLTLPPELPGTKRVEGMEATTFHLDGDEVHIEHWSMRKDPEPEEDEYGLVPDDLQRELDKEARAVDRAMRGLDPADEDVSPEMEFMDQCLEHSETRPVVSLLDDIDKLPRPEALDDEAVETELKNLLMQLAMLNVTLDVCEHCTPRDCYRMLLDDILAGNETYEEFIGTGWTHHMMTSEYCPKCLAENEDDAEMEGDS